MTEKDFLQWEEDLTGEALLLSVLGRLWYRYPDPDEQKWILSLFDNEIFSEVPYAANQPETEQGLDYLCPLQQNHQKDGFFDSIQADYLRLFIGPGKVIAPPWESVHFSKERLTFQEQTLDVRNWYRRFGLVSEKIYKEPDDHIGLEISFVAHLTKLALNSLEEQDENKFAQLLDAQREFLAAHLLRWGPYWCTLVYHNAQTDFYKGISLLTQGALISLGAQFGIKTSKEVIR